MNYSDHDQCVGLVYDLDKYVNVASSALAMFNDELKMSCIELSCYCVRPHCKP